MNTHIIDEAEQYRILDTIIASMCQSRTDHVEQALSIKLAIIGAAIALGRKCPPYWTINIMCGHSDRLIVWYSDYRKAHITVQKPVVADEEKRCPSCHAIDPLNDTTYNPHDGKEEICYDPFHTPE